MGNLVYSYNVYYLHSFNNHPNYGCKSLEYSQNFRSITVSGLPYLMKNPHFDAVALRVTWLRVGWQFLVNSTTRNAQFASDNASSSNGMSEAVWVNTYSNTDHDIRAQLYNSSGLRAGQEILVDNTTIDSGEPKVAMDSRGDFLVNSATTPCPVATPMWSGEVILGWEPGHQHLCRRQHRAARARLGRRYGCQRQLRRFLHLRLQLVGPAQLHASWHSNTAGRLRQIIPVATTTHNESRSSVAMAPDGLL